jgi:hypothetical protein
MTSSARARIKCGIVRPSSLAVFRLTTKSNFTGSWIGKSAGFAPFQNPVDIVGRPAEAVLHIRAVGHQAAVVGGDAFDHDDIDR